MFTTWVIDTISEVVSAWPQDELFAHTYDCNVVPTSGKQTEEMHLSSTEKG